MKTNTKTIQSKNTEKRYEVNGKLLSRDELRELALKYYARIKGFAGVLTPQHLQSLIIPDYQRDKILSQIQSIRNTLLRGEIVPPVQLVYRPEDNDGLAWDDFQNEIMGDPAALYKHTYRVLDGQQRVTAALQIGFPLAVYIVPMDMDANEEIKTFCNFQKGRKMNTNHIIMIDGEPEENKALQRLGTDPDSPLCNCIYFGKGTKQKNQINAVAFVSCLKRGYLTISQLEGFAKFFKKLFFAKPVKSGGFKACAKLYDRLQKGGKFKLDNDAHCKVFNAFDWEAPDILGDLSGNSPVSVDKLEKMLYALWEESGFNA